MYNIYSIGPGNESPESLLCRLKKWNIEKLVDLRSEPYSQYVPQFNRDRLTALLTCQGIAYLYFGDKLGGRPPEGFEQYRYSQKYNENIELLLDSIKHKTAALMCSEFDISKCHRRFIAEDITKKGIEIKVIDKEGSIEKFELQTAKKVTRQKDKGESKGQTKLTLFGDKI